MTRAAWGELSEQILTLLKDRGPMTRSQVRRVLNIAREVAGSLMSRLNRNGPRLGKRIYVFRWTWESTGERRYPRAVYALCVRGDETDAMQPELPPHEKVFIGKYSHDKDTLPVASIFDMGAQLKKRKKGKSCKNTNSPASANTSSRTPTTRR